MSNNESLLKLFLRVLGTSALTAAFFVCVPDAWMDAIHRQLGLGKLPDAPIVSYLARSTSAFYAMLGGLLWVVSFDLRRHRVVLRYLGLAILAIGLALFVVDWQAGMPLWWRFWKDRLIAGSASSSCISVRELAKKARSKPANLPPAIFPHVAPGSTHERLSVRNAFNLFRSFHRSGGRDGDVANANEALQETLVHINGANVARNKILVTLGEKPTLQGDAIRINAQNRGGAPAQGDDQRHDQPEEKQVPEKMPPRRTDFAEQLVWWRSTHRLGRREFCRHRIATRRTGLRLR
jgi:hypothetical protein